MNPHPREYCPHCGLRLEQCDCDFDLFLDDEEPDIAEPPTRAKRKWLRRRLGKKEATDGENNSTV